MVRHLRDFLRDTLAKKKRLKINIFEDVRVCWSNPAYPYFCTSGCVWMWVLIFMQMVMSSFTISPHLSQLLSYTSNKNL